MERIPTGYLSVPIRRCPRCGRGIGCPDCVRPHRQSRSFTCNRSAVQYNALTKEWIGMYHIRGHQRYLAPLLTSLLAAGISQAMSEEMTTSSWQKNPLPLWLIPPPLPRTRWMQTRASIPTRVPHEGRAHQKTARTYQQMCEPIWSSDPQSLSLLQSSKPRWRPDAVTLRSRQR